jgi:hypothetical protein
LHGLQLIAYQTATLTCLSALLYCVLLLQLQANSAGALQQHQPDDSSLEQLMLAAARWVAHVPFVDDASFGKRRSNVWASNADFVELAGGDHEEHAHLLAGFFLELGQEVSCYIICNCSVLLSLVRVGVSLVSSAGLPLSGHRWWGVALHTCWLASSWK